MKPAKQQFDNGERPINVHANNIVWQSKDSLAEIAYLWGSTESGNVRGTLLKLPADFSGKLMTNAAEFKAVVISGQANYFPTLNQHKKTLSAGSFVSSQGAYSYQLSTQESTLIYIRSNGSFALVSE